MKKYRLVFSEFDGEFRYVGDHKVMIPKYHIQVKGLLFWSLLSFKTFSAESGMSAINMLMHDEKAIKASGEQINKVWGIV